MPIPDNSGNFKNYRSGGLDLNQHDHRSHDRDRRGGMHRDAQRAMICIAFERMHVRYLHHSQQRQQDKTQHGNHRQST